MSPKHFEDLWNEAEKTLQEENILTSVEDLIKEIGAKLSVYNSIHLNISINEEDKARLKAHTLGKILLNLTQISYKDNINVYATLKVALDEVKIDIFEAKYK